MDSKFINPPKYHNDYRTWKQEIELWTKVTGLAKAKQGIAVCLTLDGKAKEATTESDYEAYKNFDTVRKKPSTSMAEYIVDFDSLYTKIKKREMALPEAVLAFKLLDGAGLTENQRQLALTACSDLKYESMKSTLKRIFGGALSDSASGVTGDEAISMKQEAMYSASNRSQVRTSLIKDRCNRKTNPLNRFGQPTRCRICQSIFHYATNCPDKSERVHLSEDVPPSEEGVESVNITLLTQSEILIAESYGTAILDTACTKTVCGKSWLQKVLSTQKSHRPFKFGHGSLIYSDKVVTIAAKIGKTNCKIKVEVVPIELPLLLSKESLKRAGAELDIPNDEAILFGEKLKLELTSSGHYCVSIMGNQNKDEVEDVMYSKTTFQGMNDAEKRKKLLKLHYQFGHASAMKLLIQLLKSADIKDEQLFISTGSSGWMRHMSEVQEISCKTSSWFTSSQ
ncbi:Hypothetical predicted protein [Paramuricea clavata]|uniref:Uncharacterized protein n=1 Tax=Paramuricea clavata TaxID=317549 RepID=A0A6S7IZ54_PARCT|nr:Hypothetical predicted protein [Paramuricea clavata]